MTTRKLSPLSKPIEVPIIVSRNGIAKTTSLDVARCFEKTHFHVLRDIEALECSDDFRKSNFGCTYYKAENNRKKYKMYEMTRDGWTLLVMGFTGKKAIRWKEKYIAAFNRMERRLTRQPKAVHPDPPLGEADLFMAVQEGIRGTLKCLAHFDDVSLKTLYRIYSLRKIGMSQRETARICRVTRDRVRLLEQRMKGLDLELPSSPSEVDRGFRDMFESALTGRLIRRKL